MKIVTITLCARRFQYSASVSLNRFHCVVSQCRVVLFHRVKSLLYGTVSCQRVVSTCRVNVSCQRVVSIYRVNVSCQRVVSTCRVVVSCHALFE